jgi:hypothetical protein
VSERNWKEVESSLISHIDYDEPEQRLYVKFKTGKHHYAYDDVSPHAHFMLTSDASIGSHFSRNIRGKYPHHMIANDFEGAGLSEEVSNEGCA